MGNNLFNFFYIRIVTYVYLSKKSERKLGIFYKRLYITTDIKY